MIRVILPFHLQNLAAAPREVQIEVAEPPTQKALLDALEARYPVLRGSIRDHGSIRRRPLLRFFACREDISNDSPDALLPADVVAGREPFIIVGAMAGG